MCRRLSHWEKLRYPLVEPGAGRFHPAGEFVGDGPQAGLQAW
jgi:hypothetical protein